MEIGKNEKEIIKAKQEDISREFKQQSGSDSPLCNAVTPYSGGRPNQT